MSGDGLVARLIRMFRGAGETANSGRGRSGGRDGEDQLGALARHADPEVRRNVAARRDVRPDLLNSLAGDPEPGVRCAVAANAATPAHARRSLAEDDSVEVRSVLARRIAHLAPGLTTDEQDRIRRLTFDTLMVLARDQAVRVRRILAETLKETTDAPPDVIRRLARDSELVVSAPVLEFSPVLSDEDLLQIIAGAPTAGALAAISRRSEVVAPVADAIALSGDREAIAVLLGNPSAQIREETLDGLIEQAPGVEAWHDPLVHRPNLSPRAVLRLAEFVADNLVEVLANREELDQETARKVAGEVKRRLAAETGSPEAGGGGKAPTRSSRAEKERVSPYHQALKMYRSGHLEEPVLSSALSARDSAFLQAALAVRSGLPEAVVRRTMAARSPKGIVALVWKAGLSMSLAEKVQRSLARIPPNEILTPSDRGRFPLSKDEMNWQIKFFISLEGERSDSGKGAV